MKKIALLVSYVLTSTAVMYGQVTADPGKRLDTRSTAPRRSLLRQKTFSGVPDTATANHMLARTSSDLATSNSDSFQNGRGPGTGPGPGSSSYRTLFSSRNSHRHCVLGVTDPVDWSVNLTWNVFNGALACSSLPGR